MINHQLSAQGDLVSRSHSHHMKSVFITQLCGYSVHGILQARRVGSHSLLQGIILTQGSNPSLPHCGQILYHLSYQGSPVPIMVPLIFHLLVDTLNSQFHLPRMPTSLELTVVLIFSKWA